MATSLALIILLGLLSDYLFKHAKIPGLVGMLLVGVVTGPYVLDLLNPALIEVSADFRLIALIVILLRAGLKIRRNTINKVGLTALKLSIIPSTLEGLAITAVAPLVFPMSTMEAAIMGFVIAAVSPAVVVPSMIKAMDRKLGTEKGIPTLILASSSLDNAYVIVVFSTVLGMFQGATGSIALNLMKVPVSITLGVTAGIVLGLILHRIFGWFTPRATKKALVVIGMGTLLMWVENEIKGAVPFSSLLGVMAIGFVLLEKSEVAAHAISNKLAKIWVAAEILLFVLVGSQVNISVALDAGAGGLLVIAAGLAARSVGTYVSVLGTELNKKERLFCVISYIPKATVQAAIGAIPLAAGVPGGEVILAVAVLSIIVTAPLGAIGIDITSRLWLKKEISTQ